jgi:hypothetical protein
MQNQRPPSKLCLSPPSKSDKPGRLSITMIREESLQALNSKSGHRKENGFKDRGDMKEGLYKSESGIFRMCDGTLALKSNVDGNITKKPVCGHWFTELDGSHSIYEWGKITQREELP